MTEKKRRLNGKRLKDVCEKLIEKDNENNDTSNCEKDTNKSQKETGNDEGEKVSEKDNERDKWSSCEKNTNKNQKGTERNWEGEVQGQGE